MLSVNLEPKTLLKNCYLPKTLLRPKHPVNTSFTLEGVTHAVELARSVSALVWALICLGLLCTGATARAQVASEQTRNENIGIYFGFSGEIVADAWNPLRVTLRDSEPVELLLELDAGSLRRGAVPFRYSAELAGGRGLYTFQDDVYLPAWRSFSWLVRTPEKILASGSVPRYRADPKPLQLVAGSQAGAGTPLFAEGARVVEIQGADLPERAASYSGVESIVLLPQTVPPTSAAVVTAATAGSAVLFGGELGQAYADISALAPTGLHLLGAGTINRSAEVDRASVQGALRRSRLEPDALLATLTGDDLTQPPAGQSATWVTLRAGAYALVLLLLLRFGGGPGVLAALLLAGILSLAAWRTRPAEPLLLRDRSVVLSSGTLALRTDLHYLFSFPGGEADVPYAAHPLPVRSVAEYRVGPETLEVDLPTYGSTLLSGKPRLEPSTLTWDGEAIVNGSENPLTDIFVTWGGGTTNGADAIGTVSRSGQQGNLAPGETHVITPGSLMLPELYTGLEELLPPGSVLARDGGTVYVLLPRVLVENDALK